MYIKVKDIVGGKTINLPHSIDNLDGCKKVAIVEVLTDSAVYETLHDVQFGGKTFKSGKYMSRDLKELGFPVRLLSGSRKTDGLRGITELSFELKELDTINNLIDGMPSNELMTYHVSNSSHNIDVMRFEPKRLRYKNLKKDSLNSLSLRITDQNNKVVKENLTATVILHID